MLNFGVVSEIFCTIFTIFLIWKEKVKYTYILWYKIPKIPCFPFYLKKANIKEQTYPSKCFYIA